MEIDSSKPFLAIAEAKTFTAGARRVNVTQAAISMQIRQLEDEVGLPLFTRTPRRVILTEAGEYLLERARKILARARFGACRDRRGCRSRIRPPADRFGVGECSRRTSLPAIMQELQREISECRTHRHVRHEPDARR